jgi:small multidrug resistance pump
MVNYLFLLSAIILEVTGTLLLPISENYTKLLPTVGLTFCYLISFYLLTYAPRSIPISIVYSTWSGLGVFFVSLFGYFVYRQQLQWQGVLGLVLIVIGVVLVNAFSKSPV